MTDSQHGFRVGTADNGLVWLNWDAEDAIQCGFALEPEIARIVANTLLEETGCKEDWKQWTYSSERVSGERL